MKRHSIFVSHAWTDNELTRQYVDGLRALGYDVWVDYANTRPGMHLSEEITAQLNARTAFVVLWTPNSVRSRNVKEEFRYFRRRTLDWPNKRFVPVHAVDCGIAANLELGVTSDEVLREWQPGQYLYVDGRYVDGRDKPIAATVRDIDNALEESAVVVPPFQLDALNEREFEHVMVDLFTSCFNYGTPVSEPHLADDRLKGIRSPDLAVIRVDELLGQQHIIVEVKKAKAGRPARFGSFKWIDILVQLEEYRRIKEAHEAWAVTTDSFDREALHYAGSHPHVKLIDRNRLVKMLRDKGVNVIADSLQGSTEVCWRARVAVTRRSL